MAGFGTQSLLPKQCFTCVQQILIWIFRSNTIPLQVSSPLSSTFLASSTSSTMCRRWKKKSVLCFSYNAALQIAYIQHISYTPKPLSLHCATRSIRTWCNGPVPTERKHPAASHQLISGQVQCKGHRCAFEGREVLLATRRQQHFNQRPVTRRHRPPFFEIKPPDRYTAT